MLSSGHGGKDKVLTVPSISGGKAFFRVIESITAKPADPYAFLFLRRRGRRRDVFEPSAH